MVEHPSSGRLGVKALQPQLKVAILRGFGGLSAMLKEALRQRVRSSNACARGWSLLLELGGFCEGGFVLPLAQTRS